MTIGGLQPSTTYHYRVVAEYPCDGITNYSGEDQTFTTGPSGGVLRASAKRPVATTIAPAGATGLRLTAQRSGRNPVRLRPADHTAGQAWTITRPGAGLAARLVNAGSGLCLGVHRWSHGARAAVVAEACRKQARSQQWTQLRLKEDQWRFVNRRTDEVLSARLSSRGVAQRAGRRGADEAWTVRRRAG
jgi:Ricin-type beta-trefoil lectin domain-like